MSLFVELQIEMCVFTIGAGGQSWGKLGQSLVSLAAIKSTCLLRNSSFQYVLKTKEKERKRRKVNRGKKRNKKKKKGESLGQNAGHEC